MLSEEVDVQVVLKCHGVCGGGLGHVYECFQLEVHELLALLV